MKVKEESFWKFIIACLEIDEWLEKECNIHAGCCSSIESLRYNVGREVAEKLWNKNNSND